MAVKFQVFELCHCGKDESITILVPQVGPFDPVRLQVATKIWDFRERQSMPVCYNIRVHQYSKLLFNTMWYGIFAGVKFPEIQTFMFHQTKSVGRKFPHYIKMFPSNLRYSHFKMAVRQ